MNRKSIVHDQQLPLKAGYLVNPELALITDVAIVEGKNFDDPFHTLVSVNEELMVPFTIGVHRAVGGLHDFPNPGDLLCASLAACFESTLRMISNILGVSLKRTFIRATAKVDVRGTLMLDKNIPVGFQSMVLDVEIEVDNVVNEATMQGLLGATEKSCIIFQTLKPSLSINVNKKITYTNELNKSNTNSEQN